MVEVFYGWRFCLNIADDALFAIPDSEIGIAGFGLLG